MAIDLLVLGLDGVMFDTEAAHLLSCNHALEQCGYDHRWSLQQFRNAALLHGAGNPFGAMARTSDSAMLHEEKERLFHELICESRVALHSGCVGLIEEALEEGCKLAIVTDLPARTATVLLEQAFCDRLTDMFAAIASSASVDFFERQQRVSPRAADGGRRSVALDCDRCFDAGIAGGAARRFLDACDNTAH